MTKACLLLLAAVAAFADEDPWAKVSQLKAGSELRIYKTHEKRPLTAVLDEVRPDSVVVVVKNSQVSIPKSRIERIDSREHSARRVDMETRKNVGTPEEVATGRSKDSNLPPGSTSSGIRIHSKPEFETVYKRAPAGSPK